MEKTDAAFLAEEAQWREARKNGIVVFEREVVRWNGLYKIEGELPMTAAAVYEYFSLDFARINRGIKDRLELEHYLGLMS